VSEPGGGGFSFDPGPFPAHPAGAAELEHPLGRQKAEVSWVVALALVAVLQLATHAAYSLVTAGIGALLERSRPLVMPAGVVVSNLVGSLVSIAALAFVAARRPRIASVVLVVAFLVTEVLAILSDPVAQGSDWTVHASRAASVGTAFVIMSASVVALFPRVAVGRAVELWRIRTLVGAGVLAVPVTVGFLIGLLLMPSSWGTVGVFGVLALGEVAVVAVPILLLRRRARVRRVAALQAAAIALPALSTAATVSYYERRGAAPWVYAVDAAVVLVVIVGLAWIHWPRRTPASDREADVPLVELDGYGQPRYVDG
jgi:hypothetical protein